MAYLTDHNAGAFRPARWIPVSQKKHISKSEVNQRGKISVKV